MKLNNLSHEVDARSILALLNLHQARFSMLPNAPRMRANS